MSSHTSDDERQPLLSPDHDSLLQSVIIQTKSQWFQEAITFLKDPILICTFCLQFCTYFAKHMVEVPLIRLLEGAICNRYYALNGHLTTAATGSVNEGMCKIPPIQNELASIVGLKFTFDALPGKYHELPCFFIQRG